MIRSAVSSISIRLVRHNSLPSPCLAAAASSSKPKECSRHNDSSARSFYSTIPAVINPTKLVVLSRQIHRSPYALFATNASPSTEASINTEEELVTGETDPVSEELNVDQRPLKGPPRDVEKDRSKVIPLETGIRYLNSDAYKQTYGDVPVWVLYRRNFKGQFAPKRTRKTCIRDDHIATGNPCPICRDEFLVLDYRNVDLLKQFISPFNGEILGFSKTGLCQKRHTQLLVEILKAKDYGTITFDFPVREYDYAEYEHLYKSYNES